MKFLFFSVATMAVVLSCSRENGDNEIQNEQPTKKELIFRTENLSFTDAPDIPEKIWLSTSTYYNKSIYVSNGQSLYEFNTNNDSWKALPNYNNVGSYWGNIMTNGYSITYINGRKNGLLNDTGYVFQNDGKNTIRTFNIPQEINYRSAGYAEAYGKHYLAGGSNISETEYNTAIYQLELNSKGEVYNVVKLTDMPEAKHTQIEIINQRIYVIGGYDGKLASRRIDFYDMKTNQWTFVGEMPYGFSSHTTAIHNGKIWIVGNYNLNDQQLAYYDTQANEFVTINSNIKPRRHANAEIINGKLYVFGGAETSYASSTLTSMQVANLK